MWLAIMVLMFSSVFILGRYLFPVVVDASLRYQQKRSEVLADKMDRMFVRVKVNKILLLYTLGPVVLCIVGFMGFPNQFRLLGALVGLIIGFLGPSAYVKLLMEKRRDKFTDQLVDALMILSSSLKGGLSLIQAMEVVAEEMPEPINQEVGILLGENKMGVSLEEAFAHLYERMPSVALHQLITAILLARETGGNLPVIFARIVTTIRENKKIKQNIDNLTLQGKIQGTVMTILPIAFGVIVHSTNPRFFDVMVNSEIGRLLLVYSFFSQCIGAFLIWKISVFKEF